MCLLYITSVFKQCQTHGSENCARSVRLVCKVSKLPGFAVHMLVCSCLSIAQAKPVPMSAKKMRPMHWETQPANKFKVIIQCTATLH